MSGNWAMSPWEYNDPSKFEQGHGTFSEVAVYARGNAFPWRVAEVTGPDEATTIATAHLIAASPSLYEAVIELLRLRESVLRGEAIDEAYVLAKARAALSAARGEDRGTGG